MDLTEDEVREILMLIENSSFDHLELEVGELKLTVSKGPFVPEHPVAAAATQPATPAAGATDPPAVRQGALPGHEVPTELAGLVPVVAPMVGTFYAAPKPGMPSFVEQGARVTADTTVGLIEVMKVFTGIRAGIDGVIEEIRVSDGEFVEFGHVLFLVKPDSDGAKEGAGE